MASPKLTILLGFTLLAFQQETFCDERANQGTEAYSRFSEFVKYENHLLDIQRLSITRVNLPIECALGCVRLPGCLSFNIEIDKPLEIASSLICELLSAGKLGNSRRFRRSKKFDHYETSVS
ncbi:hypothetical protein OS493_008648 [Desmophyllum pertusum]|uniref:Apple domain-containing protein n=1 Tax=Desmophyllum pertusum TaxID=174260 RepID=A0A9W9ZT21_9CNID|nr:hypothetical protein OS493_008648 [Desmophyllum pertusum]